jgi:hypothetical protein
VVDNPPGREWKNDMTTSMDPTLRADVQTFLVDMAATAGYIRHWERAQGLLRRLDAALEGAVRALAAARAEGAAAEREAIAYHLFKPDYSLPSSEVGKGGSV